MPIRKSNVHRPHIGRVLRDAHAFDPKNQASVTDVNAEDLLQSVARFFDLLDEHAVDYVLVGGVAMLQYVEGRNTQDIDLIVGLDALEALPEVVVTERSDPHFARATFERLQVDVLRATHPLFDDVRREHVAERHFADRRVRCATVEGLLLLKLFALPSLYRQGDLARVGIYESDIAALLYEYDPDLNPLFEKLRPHLLETDLGELHSIVSDMRRRTERFGGSAGTEDRE